MIDELIRLIRNARVVFICGNGGSASTAEHFATDLVKKGIPALALSSNSSLTTMIANDYGYEKIFSKQLDVFGTKDDLLITISCSGKSPNIESALQVAYVTKGMSFIELPTFKEAKHRDYGKLEDEHLRICHEVAKKI